MKNIYNLRLICRQRVYKLITKQGERSLSKGSGKGNEKDRRRRMIMDGRMDARMVGQTDGLTGEQTDGRTDVWMDGQRDGRAGGWQCPLI